MRGFGRIEKGAVGWLEKPDPVIGPSDAIVRPIAIAPCTSDVHTAYHMDGPYLNHRILGHECVGEVLEVGAAVRDFNPGDKVVVPAVTPLWRHPDVQDGSSQHEGRLFGSFLLSSVEDGAFAEKIAVRSADMNLAILPEGMKPETAVMAVDMMTTGFHGAELGEVKFGDTVVVFGIGPVGLMAVAGSVLMGAGRLIAVGTRPDCVALARQYGATDIISYKLGNVKDQILTITEGRGADVSIVAGGDMDTFNTALDVLVPGGILSNLNVFSGVIDTFDIPFDVSGGGWMGHKTIRGGLCPGGRRRMERLLSIISNGRVDPTKMITHRFNGLDSVEQAFQLMVDKPSNLIKPVVLLD